MLYLGSDHRGFNLKNQIKIYLTKLDYTFKDLGATTQNEKDDYTDFAQAVAIAVAKNPNRHRGIVICGSGAGVCITANKIKKIKAALATNIVMAKAGKADDNTNVLCIAANNTTTSLAKRIIKAWLETKYISNERHERRIKKIEKIEELAS